MGGRVLHLAVLLFLCVLLIPDTNVAENAYSFSEPVKGTKELEVLFPSRVVVNPTTPDSETIKGAKDLDYQDNRYVFLSRVTSVQKDTPVVNPTSPVPPATTGPTNPGSSGGAWCIANSGASTTALQVALDYACGYGGTDCSALQPNAPCFEPNTVADHASYAFNDYYQKNPVPTSCVFGGVAQLSYTDPSHGNCHFASPTSNSTMPPPTPMMSPPTPMMPPPTPPSSTMPTSPDTPIGGDGDGSDSTDNDYGAEPTGLPSSAEIVSSNLVLLISASWLIVPLIMARFV